MIGGQGYHATWRARTLGDIIVLEESGGTIIKDHYGNFYIVDETGEGRTYDSAIETMQALNGFVGDFGSNNIWM
jgi:hypothetical protein